MKSAVKEYNLTSSEKFDNNYTVAKALELD
jgi:hypothetical protein